jgi:hypothetical protein
MKKNRRNRHSRTTGLPIHNTNVDLRIKWVSKELNLDKYELKDLQIKLDNKYCQYNPEDRTTRVNNH